MTVDFNAVFYGQQTRTSFEHKRVCIFVGFDTQAKHTVVQIDSHIELSVPSVSSDELVPKSHTWVGNFIEQVAGRRDLVAGEVQVGELVKNRDVGDVGGVLEEMLMDFLGFG